MAVWICWLIYRVQQICFSFVDEFENEFSEKGVLPREPCAGVIRGVVAREGLVHEARSGVGGHQGDNAVADLLVVGRREGTHHDAHGPDHLHTDMRTADAFARRAAPEIGIVVAPDEAAGVFIHGVRALHIAQVGHRQQRRNPL